MDPTDFESIVITRSTITENMNHIHHRCLYYFILLFIHHLNAKFSPNITDYDAYGVKIAMNDYFLVLAQNDNQTSSFFIQFAPYNSTQSSSQCSITYPNTTNTFIYTVAIGKKQNQNQIQFFFAGELTNDQSGPFVGIATYNNTNQNSTISNTTSSFSCNTNFSYSVQYLHNYEHQEYYILGVDPTGVRAYGFSNEFVFVFDSENTSNLHVWDGNLTWPDSSFIPHAVDVSDEFGVIAGFIRNAANSTVQYSPMIYLINFNASNYHQPIVVHQHKPNLTLNTWEALLPNADANFYSAKYDMSVSIDTQGNILVGMQFINQVFLLSVNITNPIRLTYVSRYTNGRSLGNGKSVAWLDDGIAAVLINVYTLDYQWSLSQFFLFDIYETGYNSTTTPLSVFPNSHQLLPSSFSPVFLNVISSPSSLALLDDKGQIIIFSPTQPGFYAFVQDTGLMPFATFPKACSAGAHKNKIGVHDCVLCPTGTKNPGNSGTQCIPCLNGSFCPLGSVADVSVSILETISQVIPYPLSPESVIFDEILLQNMFSIGSGRCIVVSPLFWALVVASIVIIIIIIMEIWKLCIKDPRSERLRNTVKRVFRHTDLIGEGEFWVGGLASFSVIVLVSFAYAFSNAFLKQYPIETSSPSYFACDTTMRNAKFRTNVQSLAIPLTNKEQEMFDLLNNQEFTLNLDFINTLINCDTISIQAQVGPTWETICWLDCKNVNSILTLSIRLPYQHISIKVFLADTKTIGALRIGLSGPGHKKERFMLKDLEFYQSFSKDGHILSETLLVAIEMTKVINETHRMVGDESDFGGIYVPTFTVDMHSLVVSNAQYIRSELKFTTLTIVITETSYYVKNLQQPIARQSEIVFRNLLFTIVCLEIFGLVFISYKIVLKPFHRLIIRNCVNDKEKTIFNEKQTNDDLIYTNNSRKSDAIDSDYISSTF